MTYESHEVLSALASRLDAALRQLDYAREAEDQFRRDVWIGAARVTIENVQAALRGEAPDRNVVPLRKMAVVGAPTPAQIERAYVSPQADGGRMLNPEPGPAEPRCGACEEVGET